jgi:hypothetical protein
MGCPPLLIVRAVVAVEIADPPDIGVFTPWL